MKKARIAVLAVANASGEQGGAEKFYHALTNALCKAGVQAEQINVLADESNMYTIKEAYLRFYELDLSSYDGVISTKAPAYLVRHPNHVSYLQHTMRVFYDMFEETFTNPDTQLLKDRNLIHQLDRAALSYPYTKKLFVIGHEVKNRLLKHINIESEVIYESLVDEVFESGKYHDYIFMPGRLHRWKRVDLVIKAMEYVTTPIKLKIAGIGENEDYFKSVAGNNPMIEFLGRITDEELISLYSNALAIPFVPIREDFGLVTIEAFRSAKPVLTCTDSGEPTFFVKNGNNGFICPPDPEAIASKLDFFYNNPEETIKMGKNGEKSVSDITWLNITTKLLKALNMENYSC